MSKKSMTSEDMEAIVNHVINNITLDKIVNNEFAQITEQHKTLMEQSIETINKIKELTEKNELYKTRCDKKKKLQDKLDELETNLLTVSTDKIAEYNEFKKDIKFQLKSLVIKDVADKIKKQTDDLGLVQEKLIELSSRIVKLTKVKMILEL
jgi:hypothetical protein